MINILIVDDNKKRNTKLYNAISDMEYKQYFNTTVCYTADEARLVLKNMAFDIMILDVVLPKKDQDIATSHTGLNLLNDINSNKRYITPLKIIGITAYIKDIEDYKDLFEEYTSVVLEAQYNSSKWINKITTNITSIVNAEIKKNTSKKEFILITLHGIRTYGNWQEDIKKVITENTSNFQFYSIKYGFFSFFAFLMPFLWTRVLKDTSVELEKIINSNEDREVHIIAHSFGTYVIMKFLNEKQLNKRIKTLILAGSVLPTNYLSKMNTTKKVERIVNDCGTSDYVLLLNKIFTWGLSDAGRIGFTIANSSNMCNRYFNGGHDLYFNKEFYKQFWLPIILTDNDIEPIDNRKYKWYSDITEFIYGGLSRFKYLLYISTFIWLVIKGV